MHGRGGAAGQLATSDRRANLTIQSVRMKVWHRHASSQRKNPPSDIVYKKITTGSFVASSFRNNMIWYNRVTLPDHMQIAF